MFGGRQIKDMRCWKMKLAENITASGGRTAFYFNLLILFIINIIYIYIFNWTLILCLYWDWDSFLKRSRIKPVWHNGAQFLFHCDFIFFFFTEEFQARTRFSGLILNAPGNNPSVCFAGRSSLTSEAVQEWTQLFCCQVLAPNVAHPQ